MISNKKEILQISLPLKSTPQMPSTKMTMYSLLNSMLKNLKLMQNLFKAKTPLNGHRQRLKSSINSIKMKFEYLSPGIGSNQVIVS